MPRSEQVRAVSVAMLTGDAMTGWKFIAHPGL